MSIGRFYDIPLVRTAVTVAVDLAELVTAATHVCRVWEIELSQSTDVKDAEEEMIQLAWKSGQTTTGSGGNSGVTAIPTLLGDAAHGMTLKTFNTTKATGGTIVAPRLWDWNLRIPFNKIFIPERTLFLPPSTRATLELVTAPTDSITICGQIGIEIIG